LGRPQAWMGIAMARGRGRMALYEVIGKSKTLKELRPPEAQKPEVKPAEKREPAVQEAKAAPRWRAKPRAVQFNAGRIEMSVPYPLAVVVVLGVVAAVLVAFRVGQGRPIRVADDAGTPAGENRNEQAGVEFPVIPAGRQEAPAAENREPAVVSTGDNYIVITQYTTDRDLGPVQKYFAENGIETEIEKSAGRYFLVTKRLYENPNRSGTDGYAALQKIKEVGANYRAPQGYESFAPNLFSDAYGKKVK
jgi:hypothetical protein